MVLEGEKNLQPKRKNLFAWRFFYLSRRRREGEEGGKLREEKQRKEQYTRRLNSNLPWEYCKREREYLLVNKGEPPLFTNSFFEVYFFRGLFFPESLYLALPEG
jgi:hypothetical protein